MGFHKRTIKNVPLDNKTILVRVDYNVPLNKDGTIRNDLRIRASLPTIRYLLRHGCKVVLMSHLGRPDGKRDQKYTLEAVAEHLGSLLKKPVVFVDDCIGDKVKQAVKRAPKSSVVLLENVRFYPEEEKNSPAFAKKIADATGARYFVQDAFGAVHRAHASTDAIEQFVPGVAGLLVQREYNRITGAMERPKRPLVAVIGGAKVSDKVALIERFVEKADKILIGGAMANTFLSYKGYSMQKSLVEPDQKEVIDAIYAAARTKVGEGGDVDDFIILPTDLAVAVEPSDAAERKEVAIDAIPEGYAAFDIGARSIDRIVREVQGVGTVIWNGTLGFAEVHNFAHGSARLALALATQPDVVSIIGGGDTADFVLSWSGDEGKAFTHISTGGGASLELMAGEELPGIECLLDA
ncbi:phosphoglycerate kinase [Candidatus Saccharibacteria bacterium TM7i]|nr:phosphoglycerate kinase [Candidatus Saccharibacteria bacterium TM7i]